MHGPQAGQPTPEFYRFMAVAFGGGAAPFSLAELEEYLFSQPTVSPADVQNLQNAVAVARAMALTQSNYASRIEALMSEIATLRALMLARYAPAESAASTSATGGRTGATYVGAALSPTGPNSTSATTMQGMAGAITPQVTGNVLVTVSGTFIASAALVDQGIIAQLYYGTGTAPGSNAAVTGTPVGAAVEWTNLVAATLAADVHVPFSISAVVPSLTIGAAYWLDVGAKAVTTASVFSLLSAVISAIEC